MAASVYQINIFLIKRDLYKQSVVSKVLFMVCLV